MLNQNPGGWVVYPFHLLPTHGNELSRDRSDQWRPPYSPARQELFAANYIRLSSAASTHKENLKVGQSTVVGPVYWEQIHKSLYKFDDQESQKATERGDGY